MTCVSLPAGLGSAHGQEAGSQPPRGCAVHVWQRLATRWRARLGGRAPSSPTLAGWQGTSDVCQDGKLVYVHCSHCEGSGVRVPCGRVLSTHLLHRSNSWRLRGSKSTPLRGFRTHFCIFRRFRGYRGVRHEGALRQDRFKQARAGHVNSRLKIAKANNTTHSPRPLPARSMCADHTPPSMTGECRSRAQTARRMPAVHSVWRRFGLICKMITAITVMPGLWQTLQTYTFISIPLESRPAWC